MFVCFACSNTCFSGPEVFWPKGRVLSLTFVNTLITSYTLIIISGYEPNSLIKAHQTLTVEAYKLLHHRRPWPLIFSTKRVDRSLKTIEILLAFNRGRKVVVGCCVAEVRAVSSRILPPLSVIEIFLFCDPGFAIDGSVIRRLGGRKSWLSLAPRNRRFLSDDPTVNRQRCHFYYFSNYHYGIFNF